MTEKSDLQFHDLPMLEPDPSPVPEPGKHKGQRAKASAQAAQSQAPDASPRPPAEGETEIYAAHCIPGSECNMTDGCRGRLRTLPYGWGKRVQVYCPTCGKFAKGTKPLGGFTTGRRFMDRLTGQPTDVHPDQ